MSELVDALRKQAQQDRDLGWRDGVLIEQAAARIAELEAALRPFAHWSSAIRGADIERALELVGR
jgi:hypothetical protein